MFIRLATGVRSNCATTNHSLLLIYLALCDTIPIFYSENSLNGIFYRKFKHKRRILLARASDKNDLGYPNHFLIESDTISR